MGLHDKYRLHEISKDFNLNSNEILDLLTEYFGEAKTNHMTALSKEALDLLLDKFIQDNASEDVASYFAAMTSKKEEKKEVKKEAEKPKAETKKPAAKKEKKTPAEAKAEPKAEKPASKEKAPAKAAEPKSKAPEEKKHAQEPAKPAKTQPVQQPKPQRKPEDKKELFEKVKTEMASGERKQKEAKPAAKPQQTNNRIEIPAKSYNSDSPAVTVAERDDKPSSVPGGKFTKVVDTRTQITINHSKYDERLNDIAGNQGNRDYGKSKQKIVKKNKKQDCSERLWLV